MNLDEGLGHYLLFLLSIINESVFLQLRQMSRYRVAVLLFHFSFIFLLYRCCSKTQTLFTKVKIHFLCSNFYYLFSS